MSKPEHVRAWRHRTKRLMVESLGGKCCLCGYQRSDASLDFHHLDPKTKSFTIASALKHPQNWEKLVAELRKCVLLCKNCHGELHAGLVEIPQTAPRFDERYAMRPKFEFPKTPCQVCNKLKPASMITCSLSCAGKKRSKIDWDSLDLSTMVVKFSYNYSTMGQELGCSGGAVAKQLKKRGLYKRKLRPWRQKKTASPGLAPGIPE